MAKPIKKATISVDFSNTESSGREIPEDDYLLQIADFEQKDSQAGNPMIVFTHKVAEGPFKGAKIWDNISLTAQALWRFRAMLEALGIDASKKLDVDLAALKGKVFRATIIHEAYQGKNKPRISEFHLAGGPAAASKSSAPATQKPSFKKGDSVTFDYEGTLMAGQVSSVDGNTVNVIVEADGSQEEWELSAGDLTKA